MDGKINYLVTKLVQTWNKDDHQELNLLLDKKISLLDNLEKMIQESNLVIKNYDIDLNHYKALFDKLSDIEEIIDTYKELVDKLSS